MGNHPQALENLLEALRINEKLENINGILRNQGNISNVNADLGDYREALNYAFKGMQKAETIGDKERLTSALLRIGDVYEKLGMLDSARVYTRKAYDLSIVLADDYSTGIALNNFGNIYAKMKLYDSAMANYRASLSYYENSEDDEGIAESTLGMARLFRISRQNDSALFFAKRSLDVAGKGGFTSYELDASQFLADHYESQRKLDSAFHYLKLTIAARDSLFSQEKIKRVQTLSFEERKRQQLIQEQIEKDAEERETNMQLMGIASVLVVLFLLLLLLSRKQTNARTVEVYGLIALLFLFEFISLMVHPFIGRLTHHQPVLMLLILVCIAAILIPLHHKLEMWVKHKLAHKIRPGNKPPITVETRRVDSEIRH
jgi:tetratricopeptide (TPR) repeat protein